MNADENIIVEKYADFAYKRISVRRKYILSRFSTWFRRRFNTNGKVILDFGCGRIGSDFSPIYQQTLSQNDGDKKNYFGYDIDVVAKSLLREHGCYYDYYNDDSRLGQFDMIFAHHVYEHLERCEKARFLKRAHELLTPSGRLVLAFPFGLHNLNFSYFWEDITHKPVGVEVEGSYVNCFGFDTEVFVGGVNGSAYGILDNIICFLRNILLFYPPFWVTVVDGVKTEEKERV